MPRDGASRRAASGVVGVRVVAAAGGGIEPVLAGGTGQGAVANLLRLPGQAPT
ncbi:hypothetical protein AB0F88_31835 [Streptosporangium sp. NPDC023963]|uniref:hypothetical protein n=1 Tax=Streptosporangium sp. NPDC023963 TaxID=3155608 RepID=UPI003428CDCB